ncbi:hypothetical protein DSC45_07930 [Streptomyces sp. YIM 130001]|uniref:uridine kinase family protein n=1 Tax=Streptomyces sp. YIM 130001 TaxID=2259644 RepID=UPI000EE7C786|nr:hypothetical protein [Streptomyces sp. YIM 130001]RII19398.1 hypothetical protein DSC45_07930 [Streptomyces sp. YIM 130001]
MTTSDPDSPAPRPTLTSFARALCALRPSCGPVRLIGIDGHAGSGKSTFADRLAGVLGGAPVLRLDDVRSHDALFDWTDRLDKSAIEPFRHGRDGVVTPYDWERRRYGPEQPVEAAPVVLLEGVGAGRAFLRPHLAWLVWMDLPRDAAWTRGRDRDGSVQSEFWDAWEPAERAHFAGDPTIPWADTVVRQSPEGYVLLPGPRRTAGQPRTDTDSDGPSAVR